MEVTLVMVSEMEIGYTILKFNTELVKSSLHVFNQDKTDSWKFAFIYKEQMDYVDSTCYGEEAY